MYTSKDLTNQRFGKLTVVGFAYRKNGRKYWDCICECGNRINVQQGNLVTGNTKSCGCSHRKHHYEDLVGRRFGNLTVQSLFKIDKGQVKWHCVCDCGNETNVLSGNLKSGHTTSCGCNQRKRASEHTIPIDLTGNEYGKLTVVKYAYSNNGNNYWECKCKCGNVAFVSTTNLRRGLTKSCGCLVPKFKPNDLTGLKFQKLTVLYQNGYYYFPNGDRLYKWHCRCECGNECDVIGSNLLNGDTKSCGCAISIGESNVKKILNELNIEYISQYSFKNSNISSLRFDFAIIDGEDIIGLIEYDGVQHFKPTKFHHISDEDAETEFIALKERDSQKEDFAKDNNIPLLRIDYAIVDINDIRDIIAEFVDDYSLRKIV